MLVALMVAEVASIGPVPILVIVPKVTKKQRSFFIFLMVDIKLKYNQVL